MSLKDFYIFSKHFFFLAHKLHQHPASLQLPRNLTFFFLQLQQWRIFSRTSSMAVWMSVTICRLSDCPALWSRCSDCLYRHSWSPEDEAYWFQWSHAFPLAPWWGLTWLVLKNNLTYVENLDFQWFNVLPFCSDVDVYSRVCQYTVTSLLGVVTCVTCCLLLNYTLRGNVVTAAGWIARNYGADIHGLLRMNYNNFGDPLTRHLPL